MRQAHTNINWRFTFTDVYSTFFSLLSENISYSHLLFANILWAYKAMDVINIKTEKRAIHKFQKSKRYIEDRIKLEIPFLKNSNRSGSGCCSSIGLCAEHRSIVICESKEIRLNIISSK